MNTWSLKTLGRPCELEIIAPAVLSFGLCKKLSNARFFLYLYATGDLDCFYK